MCRLVLKILTLFETKTCHTKTCHSFSDLTSKIHTSFQTWRRTVTKRNIHVYEDINYIIITEMRTPTKKYIYFLKSISNSHIMGSYVIHLEPIDNYVLYTTVAPSKTIPDSRPKWAKSLTVFRPKRRKNLTLWGGTYLNGLYNGVAPSSLPLPP